MRKLPSLLLCLIVGFASGADQVPIELGPSPVRVVAGGSVRLAVSAAEQTTLSRISSVRVTTLPDVRYQATAGVSDDGRHLFVAVPPTMPPGAYSVALFAESNTGAQLRGSIELVVEPFPPVAQTGRPPVILINGFSLSSVLTGECPISEDSTGTFGGLEEYLAADGASVVFFDNCRFGTPPIEVLGRELGKTIAALENTDDSPIEQVDLIAFSMGALVVRSYLSGKQTEPGTFSPPVDPKVRKAVLVAGEHFGTPLANGIDQGNQLPQLSLGSRFMWDLATWHQGLDDLREVDALAIAGNGARDGSGDGVAPLMGASISAPNFFALGPGRTRILPRCHNGQARFFCNTSEVLMRVGSEEHPTARIIRSFLAGGDEWRQIGETPAENPRLAENGGVYFLVKDAFDELAADVDSVVAMDAEKEGAPALNLSRGPGGGFVREMMPSGRYQFTVQRGEVETMFTADVGPWGYNTITAKPGPLIARIQPAAAAVETLSLAAGSLISIFGSRLAAETAAAQSLPLPNELAGTTVSADGNLIPLLFVGLNQINAFLPPELNGLVRITVENQLGRHSLNVLLDAAVPAVFTLDGSGVGPAAAIDALTGELLTADNPAAAGRFVSLFATGLGAPVNSGGFEVAEITPEVFIGGVEARVLFAGRAPGFVGLDQINIEIPLDTITGQQVPVTVKSGKRFSNTVALAIE